MDDAETTADYDCTINFSDGEWEWYNKNGELINNGTYSESDKYQGLISMSVTEDSEKPDSIMIELCPLLLYIYNGEIYSPYYLKP